MQLDRFFSSFNTVARGLEAQRKRMGAAAENIANANTSQTDDGDPYRPKRAVQEAPDARYSDFYNLLDRMSTSMSSAGEGHSSGPSLERMLEEGRLGPVTDVEEQEQFRMEYDPSHPHADENGFVQYPDINIVDEMSRMISANRIYEANLTALDASKKMMKNALQI